MLLRSFKALGLVFEQHKAYACVITKCPGFGLSFHSKHFSTLTGGKNMASVSISDFETRYVKKGATNSLVEAETFFKRCDSNGKGYLDQRDFSSLIGTLFSHNGIPYSLTDDQKQILFGRFDKQKTGKITLPVFTGCWTTWLKSILDPVSALLIIDVQNDFISGSLGLCKGAAKHNGEEVVPIINKLLQDVNFNHVIYTRDWHPADHISFFENRFKYETTSSSPLSAKEANTFDTVTFEGNPPMDQVLWPTHCVQEEEGAAFHKDLKIVKDSVIFDKGTESNTEYYSAFKDVTRTRLTTLAADLKKLDVTNVYTCGLAYDFCVGETSIDAVQSGFCTVVIDDATRGTCNTRIGDMKERLKKFSVPLVNSNEVVDLVNGKDRRPELAF